MSVFNMISFVKALVPKLSRSDLESDLSISVDTVNTVLSTYKSISEINKAAQFTSKSVQQVTKDFYSEYAKADGKTKLSNRKDFASDLVTLFENVQHNAAFLEKEIQDLNNEVIVTQALTAYKTNIVRAVGHLYFMGRFALDLANFIYVEEVTASKAELPKEAMLNKKQREFITKNLWIFARLISVYGEDAKRFKERFEELGDISVPKEHIDEAVAVYGINKIDIFNNLPSGFIGSPIYTVGLIFAEWEATRYRHLKDKKRLLELRYLHLRMLKEQGQGDASTEKEISNLQRSITDMDYSISKIEESVA